MSTAWVPWKPDPQRYEPAGLKALVWGPVLVAYRLFKRFPALIFWSLCVLAVLVVWIHSLLFAFMDAHFLSPEAGINGPAHSFFGGALSLEEIRRGLSAYSADVPQWLAYLLYPLGHEFVRDIICMGGVIGIVSLIPLFCIWWERKVSAHIQNRVGPMRVGGWHGWTQTVADGIKLIAKEDLVPKQGDGPLFRVAAYVAFVPPIVAFLALPFGSYWVFRNTDIGLLFVLAMLGVEVMGVILAGWASNNKWSIYGAMREACQMVSYEIPLGMALLLPIITVGTLNLNTIGDLQTGGWFTWLCFSSPFMFCAALAYFVASLASCKRAPFDLAESESELVAGFLTEYSGFRWSMFFFGEYCAMFVVSGLATILFFGGWHFIFPESWVYWLFHDILKLDGILLNAALGVFAGGPLWFIFKCMLLIYVQMWVRWTLPRIRIDQLLYACVQVLLPVMMLLLLGQAVWVVYLPSEGPLLTATRAIFGTIGLVLVLSCLVVIIRAHLRRRRLVGYLAIDVLPGS